MLQNPEWHNPELQRNEQLTVKMWSNGRWKVDKFVVFFVPDYPKMQLFGAWSYEIEQ